MTKITRKLLLSIITVVLTVVALGTTTFAWFTLTNTASIQEFEANIIADSGIEIAIGDLATTDLNNLEWKTVLTPADIYNYYGGTLPLLNHVTSPDGINFYTLGTTSKGGGVTTGFLEIPIHFRSDSADVINWTQVSITGQTVPAWPVDVAFTDATGLARAVGSTMTINPADAIRVAIQGNVGSNPLHVVAFENPTAGSNVALNTGGNFGTNVYDPGMLTPSIDPNKPGSDTDVASNPSAYANGSYQYFFNKNSGEVTLWGIEDVKVVETVPVVGQPIVDLSESHGTTLTQKYYGNITIRIWLEGWDANSFDAQLAKLIRVKFEFFGVDTP